MNFIDIINKNYLTLNEILTKINFFYITNHIISFYFDNIILLNLIILLLLYIIIREINFSYKIKKIVKFDKSLDNCEKSNYIKQDFEEQNNVTHLEERLKIFEQNNVTHLEERLKIFEQNNVTHLEERLKIFEQNNVKHLEERLKIFEQNNVTHLEERLKIFEEQNNVKRRNNYNIFSIVPIGINSLLDINSKKIKITGCYSTIEIGNHNLPYLSEIDTCIDSKKLYSDFLEQFKNIELIEIEFANNVKGKSINKYLEIMINTFENFEIIFKCITLYDEYDDIFNIFITSSNYNKITLYIKDNLNVNKETGNASYVTEPYINKLKDHCIKNNIEIQSNIGI